MLYFGNPCGDAVIALMGDGLLGLIDTPGQKMPMRVGQAHDVGATWCADNSCFGDKYPGDEAWFEWLTERAHMADTCAFATAPDVVGDAEATLTRSLPWLPKIRALGYRAAFVAQDGIESIDVPWADFDCLFIGGTDLFKLGANVRSSLIPEAKRRGKTVHMGRVNSEKRYRYAVAIGCDSADGTFFTYGPEKTLPRFMSWLRTNDQGSLWEGATP